MKAIKEFLIIVIKIYGYILYYSYLLAIFLICFLILHIWIRGQNLSTNGLFDAFHEIDKLIFQKPGILSKFIAFGFLFEGLLKFLLVFKYDFEKQFLGKYKILFIRLAFISAILIYWTTLKTI